jgi:hypothetical protein
LELIENFIWIVYSIDSNEDLGNKKNYGQEPKIYVNKLLKLFNVDTKSTHQAVIEIQNDKIWTYGNENRLLVIPAKKNEFTSNSLQYSM